jgi:putative ATP-dependent endonuclease of OLD family
MKIKKVVLSNFKSFKDKFTLPLNSGMNIIVGNNEAGKSTLLEAINLVLTGLYNGRPVATDLSQYLFNQASVQEYINSVTQGKPHPPPELLIELYFEDHDDLAFMQGDGNSEKSYTNGLLLKIELKDEYNDLYEALIATKDVKTLPIEYYHVVWKTFARQSVLARNIPLRSAFIDSSASRYQNGSDVYISRIIKDLLTQKELVDISQSHRKMKEHFMGSDSIEAINTKISSAGKISDKAIKICVELSGKNAWENSLMTYLNDIPFHFIGKGEQSIVKTNLALAHDKTQEANILLIEEPENHLSHVKLNQLINTIKDHCQNKQIIITTHSSFVANKLGLTDLILLSSKKTLKLKELSTDTSSFFEKISGYDTLRLILGNKAILVEGDSDELVVQKAYLNQHKKLPIEDGVEVISVGVSFLRFLEIAKKLSLQVIVVTDNDGDVSALQNKYVDYLDENKIANIKICFDSEVDTGDLKIGTKAFNYNTLEPKMVKVNGFEAMKAILNVTHKSVDDLHIHMKSNKTECALKLFNSEKSVTYPQYILDSINE